LRAAGVQAGATQVVGRSVDGFTVGFPTDVALDGRESMVVVGMNGEPLPAEHGFPARLIVPGLYGYVSATKWLGEIELTTLEGFDAYWVTPRRGWAKEGPIKLQSRIDVPKKGGTLGAGNVRVAGVAWGGLRGVSGVQLRAVDLGAGAPPPDEGWIDGHLSEELSDSSWRQWVVDWPATSGRYELQVRAIDRSGAVQTSQVRSKFPDGATGHHKIRVTVTA
ncbi:MAG: molybdopterin-dependent oxidoreductase, partial [Chloroflexi bacterium]|nr:molybdopterin-dependent oxidoreductase [Chloroflexota bacterium]